MRSITLLLPQNISEQVASELDEALKRGADNGMDLFQFLLLLRLSPSLQAHLDELGGPQPRTGAIDRPDYSRESADTAQAEMRRVLIAARDSADQTAVAQQLVADLHKLVAH